MTVAIVHSRALVGVDAPLVTVEVHLSSGLPGFNLVGLPEMEAKEARDRVRAALQNSQFEFPQWRITVNLAPAELPKESGGFDLPIAIGILVATGQLKPKHVAGYEFAGELALTGELRPIRGALAMTLKAHRDGRAFIVPAASAGEAALVRDAVIHPARTLLDVCAHLIGKAPLPREELSACAATHVQPPDLAEVKGQPQAKRVLEIAAAGNHSLLILCPSEPTADDHSPPPTVSKAARSRTRASTKRRQPELGFRFGDQFEVTIIVQQCCPVFHCNSDDQAVVRAPRGVASLAATHVKFSRIRPSLDRVRRIQKRQCAKVTFQLREVGGAARALKYLLIDNWRECSFTPRQQFANEDGVPGVLAAQQIYPH